MKINYRFLCLIVFLLSGTSLFAQQRTITGTVTDSEGIPLPGVNIVVEGTNRGSLTDFDGNFSIDASVGEVLVFSFVGLETQRFPVGQDTATRIDVQLGQSSELDEVIITAQGIRRERKALGYAVSTVSAAEIERKPQQDIARALSGKVAGVQITGTGGATGSGTQFLIRSKNSINGSNQPLFIVDGVPFDSGTNSQASFVDGNTQTSSRFLDLDPNNIETISVLKGLSASVLYGEQGRNGVVLITTKTGSSADVNKKFEISLNNTTYITQISNLPDFQNEYGQGSDQLLNRGFVGNWGSRFDENLMIEHPYSASHLAEAFPEFQGLLIPYEAAPNNVSDFFRDGLGRSTSLLVSGGSGGNSSVNLSVAHTEEEGFIPNNHLNRLNIGLGGTTKLTNNFSFTSSFNFASTRVVSPPIAAANGIGAISIFTRLIYIPRNLDLTNLPYQNPIDGSSVFYRTDLDNPYWLLENAGSLQETRRFFGNLGANYSINDHITASYTYGLDTYTDNQRFHVNKGSVTTTVYNTGYLRMTSGVNTIQDHNISLAFSDYSITDDFNFQGRVGFNARRDEYTQRGTASTNQVVFGVLNERNFVNQSQTDPITGFVLSLTDYRNILGLYAQAEFDYGSYLFLTLSGRNDWGSTVEAENQSLFYPGVSLSFIPTSAFNNFGGSNVNFLKLRAGYGTSAGFPTAFNTRPTLAAVANAFIDANGNAVPTNSVSVVRANPNLKPELHKEVEVGIEGNFFKNRLNLDLTGYKRVSEDQILTANLPPSTGFTSTTINAGRIDTEGLEASLYIGLIETTDFSWNLNNIFTAYETTVVDLPDDFEDILYVGFGNLGNAAVEGEPLGVIKGSYIVRDDEGNIVINPNDGKVINSATLGLPIEIIGDPNPDWNLTVNNTFRYKGLSLSAQVEYQHGGDIYSNSVDNLLRRGVVSTIDRERPHIIPGVLGNPNTGEPLLDAQGNKIPNNIQISPNDMYFLNLVDPSGAAIYDATHIRLRDVTLAYQLPGKYLDKTPFGSMSFALSGQNLYVKAFNFPDFVNFDPETLSTGVGNGAGLDFQTAPQSRRIAFSFNATF